MQKSEISPCICRRASCLAKLAGTPAQEIATLQPEKPPEEADIGELEKAESKEQKQAGLEKQDQASLSEYFLKHDAPEKYRQALRSVEWSCRKEKDKLEKSITTTMVMAEMNKPRDTFVLGRGQYDNQGEKVTPGVPAFLPPMPEDLPRNRLGLGKVDRRPLQPAHCARGGQSATGNNISGPASSRPPRTLARRVSRRAILNCSTGWPPNSSALAGTSRPCSA